jgi:HrpA-like RNA helicase
MADRLPPEILRVDLSNVILKLKGLGIADILTFELLERPD